MIERTNKLIGFKGRGRSAMFLATQFFVVAMWAKHTGAMYRPIPKQKWACLIYRRNSAFRARFLEYAADIHAR